MLKYCDVFFDKFSGPGYPSFKIPRKQNMRSIREKRVEEGVLFDTSFLGEEHCLS